jgi:hypothetical protein
MYAGCVSGAIQKQDYLQQIKKAGFEKVVIQKSKPISIPRDILIKYLSEEELEKFNVNQTGIFSITVFGRKPGKKPVSSVLQSESVGACCAPGQC